MVIRLGFEPVELPSNRIAVAERYLGRDSGGSARRRSAASGGVLIVDGTVTFVAVQVSEDEVIQTGRTEGMVVVQAIHPGILRIRVALGRQLQRQDREELGRRLLPPRVVAKKWSFEPKYWSILSIQWLASPRMPSGMAVGGR